MNGVWIAYYSDGSEVYVFETEMDALRRAVEKTMQVRFVLWGKSVIHEKES